MKERNQHHACVTRNTIGTRISFTTCALSLGLLGACTDVVDPDITDPEATDPEPVEPVDEPPLLEPPAPGEGLQYQMTTRLDAGVEAEHCMFVRAPEAGLIINRDQVRYTRGSHHFLLYLTEYDEIPTVDRRGNEVDTSGVFDCSDGPSSAWSVAKVIGGSQNSAGDSGLSFPPGVGMRVAPGAVLLMNAHYLNASDQPLEPEVRINLYTIPEHELVVEGDLLFWYNIFIKVDGMSDGRARMRCSLPQDIVLMNAQSHMHARGVAYSAATVAGQTLYVSDRWEDVPVESYGDGLELPAGTVIDYQCDYRNGEASDVYQGSRSTDEMCMFVASYFPADRGTSLCSAVTATDEYAYATRYLGAEWVGNGAATCAQTLDCLGRAGQAEKPFRAITECVLGASPEVAREVSDVTRCMLLESDPQASCTAEIQACAAR